MTHEEFVRRVNLAGAGDFYNPRQVNGVYLVDVSRSWSFDTLARLSLELGTTLIDFESEIDSGYYPGETEICSTLTVRFP